MFQGEFIVASAIAVGIVVPIGTLIEVTHPPADLARYEIRSNCVISEGVEIPRCMYDTKLEQVVGGKP